MKPITLSIEESYKLYERLLWAIVLKDYRALHKFFDPEDMFAEAAIVFVICYNKYSDKYEDKDFKHLLVRSVHNRFKNLYKYMDAKGRSSEVSEDLTADAAVTEPNLADQLIALDMHAKVEAAVAEKMGDRGVMLLRHMLWSSEATSVQRVHWLRRRHVIEAGVNTRMDKSFTGETGMVSLEVLAELIGLSKTMVYKLRKQIQHIAYEVLQDYNVSPAV